MPEPFWERQGTPLRNNSRQEIDARCDCSRSSNFFRDADGHARSGRIVCEIAHSVLQGSPRRSAVTAIVAMGRIVHRALEREPQDRYAKCREHGRGVARHPALDALRPRLSASTAKVDGPAIRLLRSKSRHGIFAYSLPKPSRFRLRLDNLIVRSSCSVPVFNLS